MPLIVMPKFLPGEAIRSEKVDEVLAMLARVLDGGLDAGSMAPGLQFPAGAYPFEDDRSPLALRTKITADRTAFLLARLPPGIAFRLIGMAAVLVADPLVTVTLKAGGVAVAGGTLTEVGPVQRWASIAPVALADGALLSVEVSGAAGPTGEVTILLDAPHME